MKVIGPLAAVCSHVYLWRDIYPDLSPEGALSANLKGEERSREKTKKEYDGDFTKLKDLLRCSILCRDMKEIRCVWKEMLELQRKGIFLIVQSKNRFRGEPLAGGYRDIDINIIFEGFVCEVQLHSIVHFKLKKRIYPLCKFCRSFGLIGDNGDGLTMPNQNNQTSETSSTLLQAVLTVVIRVTAIAWAAAQTLGNLYFGFLAEDLPDAFDIGIYAENAVAGALAEPFRSMRIVTLAMPYHLVPASSLDDPSWKTVQLRSVDRVLQDSDLCPIGSALFDSDGVRICQCTPEHIAYDILQRV